MTRQEILYVSLRHLRDRMRPLVALYGLVADVPGVRTKPYHAADMHQIERLYCCVIEQLTRVRARGRSRKLVKEVDNLYYQLFIEERKAYRKE